MEQCQQRFIDERKRFEAEKKKNPCPDKEFSWKFPILEGDEIRKEAIPECCYEIPFKYSGFVNLKQPITIGVGEVQVVLNVVDQLQLKNLTFKICPSIRYKAKRHICGKRGCGMTGDIPRYLEHTSGSLIPRICEGSEPIPPPQGKIKIYSERYDVEKDLFVYRIISGSIKQVGKEYTFGGGTIGGWGIN